MVKSDETTEIQIYLSRVKHINGYLIVTLQGSRSRLLAADGGVSSRQIATSISELRLFFIIYQFTCSYISF